MKPQVFSFFSGAGFLDLGFETNGFEIAAANEIYEPFANAYRGSRGGMKIDLPSYGLDVDTIESYFETRKLKSLKGQLKEVRRAGREFRARRARSHGPDLGAHPQAQPAHDRRFGKGLRSRTV